MVTKANLTRIRNLLEQRQQLLIGKGKYERAPTDWATFAAQTSIKSGDGFTKFVPYQYQIDYSNLVMANKITTCVKTRQMGISETAVSMAIHMCLGQPGTTCVFISMNQKATSLLAARARIMVESIPQYCSLTTDSLTKLDFHNGSTILYINSSISATRGIASARFVVIDEAAFCQNIAEIYRAVMPTTSMVDDAKVLIISTPDKESGWFYERFFDCPEDFKAICDNIESTGSRFLSHNGKGFAFLHWSSHPRYGGYDDYLGYIQETMNLDRDTVLREYNLSFTNSDSAIFNTQDVNNAFTLEGYSEPNTHSAYYVGVDTNSSVTSKSDYFVAVVLEYQYDTGDYHLVHMYRKRGVSSSYNQSEINDLIEAYQPRATIIESNNAGVLYAEALCQMQPNKFIDTFATTSTSKPMVIENLYRLLEQGKLHLPPDSTIKGELLNYSWVDGKMQAAGSGHDDIVMALAMAVQSSPYVTGKLPNRKQTLSVVKRELKL